MIVRCQNCSTAFEAPHWQLGMRGACPSCGQETLPARDCVVETAPSGWSVTFLDFVQLVTDPDYQSTILPLLRVSGYETLAGQPLRFRDRTGQIRTAEETHASIQRDKQMQYDLYQAAMNLWR